MDIGPGADGFGDLGILAVWPFPLVIDRLCGMYFRGNFHFQLSQSESVYRDYIAFPDHGADGRVVGCGQLGMCQDESALRLFSMDFGDSIAL